MIVEELNNFSEPVLQLKNNLEQSEEPEIIVIDLAERDKKINLLNDILTQKKMQIMQQYKSCKMCNRENRSCYKNNNYNMDEIINNYEEYFRDQITNKEKQINNLNLLKNNLDELLNSDLLSDDKLNRMRLDQKNILDKLNSLNSELNSLNESLKE